MNLIDLNEIATPEPKPAHDWLQVHSVNEKKFRFGFWSAILKETKKDGEYLSICGVANDGLFETLQYFGFNKRYRDNGTYILVRVADNIIKRVTPAEIKDYALKLINEMPERINVNGFSLHRSELKEIFLRQHHILFGENVLSPLKTHEANLLNDSPHEMFFPFRNEVVKVTARDVEVVEYSHLNNVCIWENHKINRDFKLLTIDEQENNNCQFSRFIYNVCDGSPERIKAMTKAIGYILHRHYDQKNTRAVILYDQQITGLDAANGGTGKGIFANACAQLREAETVDGKKFDASDKFALQRITESTEIVFFDDVRKDFEFERFNSILTNGWEVEAKHQQTIRIPLHQSPKMIIASNSILKTQEGLTAERRQFILEFSDYYAKLKNETTEPIRHIHGSDFFFGWDDNEWQKFDNFMLRCCQAYLASGLPINKTVNVETNRLLQTTSEDFVQWVDDQNFIPGESYLFTDNFLDFKALYYGENSQYSSKSFSNWLKMYAKSKGLNYKTHRYNKITYFKFER